ncbi:N-acetylmuramoyl-L-alanine amidase [Xanthomonas phaseoli]|uniref:N-acetylmuramoyl-L-alanine amidase n=1 Tax=Xanthomonas phaseoli TaxID=1985254 RepID=UPI001E3D3DC9|nr:N-acetylmuramoyl-L-alanine amidase [Xanthomonas phaseoli]MCC8469554.1 N-acetylmuramoyl-L-alanine amidase [Xanthomonas phaseoli]
MLSAGHGLYLDYPVGKPTEWLPQRPKPSNGITEDFITPIYVSEISSALTARGSQINKVLPRSESTATHTPSGEPWWKVAARYNLQALLPDHGPDIWATLPYDKSKLREYNEDIRARPFYANYLGVDYMISVHTNASTNATSHGTTGWYHDGTYAAPSRLLTSNILCSMKEIIQANAKYAEWTIDTVPRGVTNKGENTHAKLPATIIKVGFHTNVADAVALQDPVFQKLAAKGVAKGIDINKDGKTCSTFKIDSIPTVTGPIGTPFDYKVNYSGNPTFPVVMHFETIKCASGWTCSSGTRTTSSGGSPLTYQISCTGSNTTAGTFVARRWLVDADGIKTAPVEHTYTCTPPSSMKAQPLDAPFVPNIAS